jgi:Zn-dependent metalloprotease
MERRLIRSMVAMTVVAWAAACAGKDEAAGIATEPFRHLETANALAPAELEVGASDYVRRVASGAGFALSAADDLEVRSVVQGRRGGLRHVRLKQTYGGVPVLGSEVVVHADDTTFVGINGYLTRDLDGFDITPVIGADEAVAIARRDRAAGAEEVEFTSESSRLVIAPRAAGGADLAWHIQLANAPAPALGPGLWDYLVDARSGAVLRKFDAVPLELEQASGPGGPQSVYWDRRLDVEPSGNGAEGDFWMKTSRLETYDIAKDSDIPVSGSLEEMPDPFANDAHGYAEATLAMLWDWYDYTSVDDDGRVIESYINDSSICPAGSACAPLEGEARVYYTVSWPEAAQSLGVVSHEINHNFTEFHSNLTYSGEGAMLHEHFSAVAQVAAPFYKWGEDPYDKLGEMCAEKPEGIGKLQYTFCLAVARHRAIKGSSPRDAVHAASLIWYQANAAYWTPSTDFMDACQGTIDAAIAQGHGTDFVQALRDSWADAGIECAGPDSFICDHDDRCDADETCASCSDDCGSCLDDCSRWKKMKCKLGIGDCSQCDEAAACGDGECDGDETDNTCAEDCGCAAAHSCTTVAPFGCWCDPSCLEYGDCCADVQNVCVHRPAE